MHVSTSIPPKYPTQLGGVIPYIFGTNPIVRGICIFVIWNIVPLSCGEARTKLELRVKRRLQLVRRWKRREKWIWVNGPLFNCGFLLLLLLRGTKLFKQRRVLAHVVDCSLALLVAMLLHSFHLLCLPHSSPLGTKLPRALFTVLHGFKNTTLELTLLRKWMMSWQWNLETNHCLYKGQ